MRIVFFAVTTTLACGLAVAADKPEPVTYVEGNITGVIPNSGGSLDLSDDKALEIKTGLSTVAVPYAGVSKAELGAIRQHSESEPLYKVWALHKRFNKSETQLVRVEFKNAEGEEKNLTVELEKSTASYVVQTIRNHNPSVQSNQSTQVAATPKPGAWWGDDYWKTNRNSDKWQKPGQKGTE